MSYVLKGFGIDVCRLLGAGRRDGEGEEGRGGGGEKGGEEKGGEENGWGGVLREEGEAVGEAGGRVGEGQG